MLGLMHRCAHGNAHKDLRQLFPRVPGTHAYETRQQMSRHKLQLVEERDGTHHKMLEQSIFGLIRVWNRLPQSMVDVKIVKDFQSALTELVRTRCRLTLEDWPDTLSPRRLFTPALETQYFDVLNYS